MSGTAIPSPEGAPSEGAADQPVEGREIERREVEKFEAVGDRWWDLDGPMAPLHKMQPARLSFLVEQIAAQFGRPPERVRPFVGLRALDVGCGGGLLSEALTRLGASVVGIDASEAAIATARAHAEEMGLDIRYLLGESGDLAEDVAAGREPPFDIVVASEVIEHVTDPDAFVRHLADVAAPDGLVTLTTLNRTVKSFALGVVAAEYVLGWLPRGTHDWRRFVPPEALAQKLRAAGCTPVARAGFVYDPLGDGFRVSRDDLSMNYALAAVKPA